MGFLSDLFSGVDDIARSDSAAFDDLSRFDFSGFEDRAEDNVRTVMENDALRTVGLPIADYFSFGLASPAIRAKYNKMQTGNSRFKLSDFARSIAGNYIGNQLLPASDSFTLADMGYNTAAGAGRGAISAGVQGGDVGEGAKTGAIGGGLVSAGDYVGNNYLSTPSSNAVPSQTNQSAGFQQQYLGREQNQSVAPWAGETTGLTSDDITGTQRSTVPLYVGKDSPQAYAAKTSSLEGPGTMDALGEFLQGLMPQNTERLGSNLSNLMGMYSGWRKYRDARALKRQLSGSRGPYMENLRNQLAARDAARGRRSNVGGREVQLQAALADLDARMAPAQMMASQAQFSGLDNILRSGYGLGQGMGYWGRQPTAVTPPPSQFGGGAVPRLNGMFNIPSPVKLPDMNIPETPGMWDLSSMGNRRRLGYEG